MTNKCSQCGLTTHTVDATKCLLCGTPFSSADRGPQLGQSAALAIRSIPRKCAKCGMTTHSEDATNCLLCGESFPDPLVVSHPIGGEPQANQGARQAGHSTRYVSRREGLKPRRLIAVFTALHGVVGLLGGAGLVAMILLKVIPTVSVLMVMLAIVTFTARGVCGAVGAILLWQGTKRGYQLSLVCWSYVVVVGLIAVVQIPLLDLPDAILAKHIGSTLGKLMFGIPFLYLLASDLLRLNSTEVRSS